jgi:hypothetical protein
MTAPATFSAPAVITLGTNIGDVEATVGLYGTQTGLQFAFQWSPDGVNGWAPLAVKDLGSGLMVTGTISPVDTASDGWLVPCESIYVRMNITACTGGVGNVTCASKPKASVAPFILNQVSTPQGLIPVNTAVSTVGAATLSAAAIVGGVITRTGSTGAYSDTTATAALIIAGITAPTIGMSWLLTIKNNVAFNQTLIGGTAVTLSGQTIIPANCTGKFLVTVNGATTVTIQCLQITQNCVLQDRQFVSINATTGSLAAGNITGSKECYLLSTNATPGAQLVRTGAQMFADIPNAVVGMSWSVFITNSGSGTFTLTTDAGATVTMTGTMTIPTNTTREFVVTFNSPTTATVQSVGSGTI